MWCVFDLICMIWTEMFHLDTEITETEKKEHRNSQGVTLCALPLLQGGLS